jgi:hypothetical protein
MAKNPCPICGQEMDFCVISFRNHPFIDGKTYKRMCFACANVPEEFVQTYNADGSVADEEGPFFDCKHLRTPEDLFGIGSAGSLEEAKRSVRAVRRLLKEVGLRELNRLKLTRPKPEYLDLEHGSKEDEEDDQPKHQRRKRRKKVEVKEEPKEIPRRQKPVKKKLMVQEVVVKKFTASKKPKTSQ